MFQFNMTVVHFKAEKVNESSVQVRYRYFLNFVDHENWQGVAVLDSLNGRLRVESREYDLTAEMRQREHRCLSALQHKIFKHKDAKGEYPHEVFFIA